MLSDLRKSLRGIMRESPLMDEARFVNDLERAYRSMWRSWCQGEGGLGRPADPAVP
jgi:protein O-GlcNAc transferase